MIKLNTEIKYFSKKQNFIFLFSSLLLIWVWMFIASYFDRGNDRGLITILGTTILIALIFSLLLSKEKIYGFFMSLLFLLLSSIIVFILSFTVGLYLESLTQLNWFGYIIPAVATGILVFWNIRRLISFPNNKIAFWSIFIIPIMIVIGINSLSFYDGIFAYDYGLGFLISVYFSSIFIIIGILCRKRKL